MSSERTWIVTHVDGRIASVSASYKGAASLLSRIASMPPGRFAKIETSKISEPELFALADTVSWEDLLVLGTPFQKSVWRALYDIPRQGEARLVSYSDFAESIDKASGVRAVAHAIGLNPLPVLIPCHLIIPKESIERLQALEEDENCLFKWETLYMVDQYIDYGEYSLGTALKRELIHIHLNR